MLRKPLGVSLNREAQEFYNVIFRVCDGQNNCCDQTVHIRVTDENDNGQSDGGVSIVDVFYLGGEDFLNDSSNKFCSAEELFLGIK